MAKDIVLSLTRYAESIKSRLSDKVPEKHKDHPNEYKRFLENELKATTSKIEALRLAGEKK